MFILFDQTFFEKHQKILLLVINTRIGRWLFGVEKMGHRAKGKKIERITPNSIRTVEKITDRIYFQEQFFINPEYAIKIAKYLSFIVPFIYVRSLVNPSLGWKFSFGLGTLTVYPDAGSGGTTVDGITVRNGVDEIFNTIRISAGVVAGTGDLKYFPAYMASSGTNNQWAQMGRGVFTFDTSSLESGASISTAVLSLYGDSTNYSNNFSQSFGCVSCTPAANNNLAASDYNIANWGATDFATRISIASWNQSGYNDFSLNASGISNISLTGISKFGFRLSGDIDNSAPTWASSRACGAYCIYSDNGSNKPKLVISGTTQATVTNFRLYGKYLNFINNL